MKQHITELLKAHGQEQLLSYIDGADERLCGEFLRSLESLDWETVSMWRHPEDLSGKGKIEPLPTLTVQEIEQESARYAEVGKRAIQEGKVGAVLLAGGQGTRLGSSAPKGMYDIGITRPLYIFECLINNLLEVCRDCGAFVPLFIMTSEKNDFETRAFLSEHRYFGYPEEYVRFFTQDMAPCVDFEGNLFLEGPCKLALSPNGNGGWYTSLVKAGVAKDFPAIEWYNVFAVDNVLQRIADPIFVGATILSGMNCGAKGVRKAYPEERVGVLCLENGLPNVIEYYEMDEETLNLRDANGELVYSFGVTLNYLLRAEKLVEVAEKRIPVHVVKKKIPYLNADGQLVTPERENGYKFEMLILDLVRLMESCLPFEIVREREFAPIKNKTGIDSVDTARALLEKNGVKL